MNLKKLFAAVLPVLKVAAPIIITAVVTHRSTKAAAVDVVRAELGR